MPSLSHGRGPGQTCAGLGTADGGGADVPPLRPARMARNSATRRRTAPSTVSPRGRTVSSRLSVPALLDASSAMACEDLAVVVRSIVEKGTAIVAPRARFALIFWVLPDL